MIESRHGILLAAVLLAAVSAPAAPAAGSAEGRAREAVAWLIGEQYQALWDASTPAMQQAAPVSMWLEKAGPAITALGKPLEFGAARLSQAGALTLVVLPAKFEKGPIEFVVSVDAQGKIAGLFMRPPQTEAAAAAPPPAPKSDSVVERDVTIGDGEWKLPGTLMLPKNGGNFPAVVLVHGSGPNDRDETIFANKPFRDLAEGLALEGIATLRYDKRTRVYGPQVAALRRFTVHDETIDDAVKAAQVLAAQPEIDRRRVFMLGHSLGGYLLPMILAETPFARGGIVLAGSTRPLEDIIVEQYEELIPEQAGGSEELQKQGAQVLEQARRDREAVKSLRPGTLDGPLLFKAPPSYWLALAGYDPPAEAARLGTPLLILQGERDYQVKMKDFANWKAGLADRRNVTFKSYPALNHLFIAGTGKSTPAEYQQPGHVAVEVIHDVAAWIQAQ